MFVLFLCDIYPRLQHITYAKNKSEELFFVVISTLLRNQERAREFSGELFSRELRSRVTQHKRV